MKRLLGFRVLKATTYVPYHRAPAKKIMVDFYYFQPLALESNVADPSQHFQPETHLKHAFLGHQSREESGWACQ
jgi:hypothetical protein